MVNEGLTWRRLIPVIPIMHFYEAKFVAGNWPVEKRGKKGQIGAGCRKSETCAH